MMSTMSESPEQSSTPTIPENASVLPATAGKRERQPNRLYQVAAWVVIVAGVVFIASTLFFAGLVVGRSCDGGGDGFRHRPPRDHSMMQRMPMMPPMFGDGLGERPGMPGMPSDRPSPAPSTSPGR